MIKSSLMEMNDKLPSSLKVERISGHSGRQTMITTAMNAGYKSVYYLYINLTFSINFMK